MKNKQSAGGWKKTNLWNNRHNEKIKKETIVNQCRVSERDLARIELIWQNMDCAHRALFICKNIYPKNSYLLEADWQRVDRRTCIKIANALKKEITLLDERR